MSSTINNSQLSEEHKQETVVSDHVPGEISPQEPSPHHIAAELGHQLAMEAAELHEQESSVIETMQSDDTNGGLHMEAVETVAYARVGGLDAVDESEQENEGEGDNGNMNGVDDDIAFGEFQDGVEADAIELATEHGDDQDESAIINSPRSDALSLEQVEALVASELRRIEREYADTVGESESATAVEHRSLPPGLSAAKAEKLLQLRRALAASRAAVLHAASGDFQPTMTLAPGADEFPDDYDALQVQDAKRLQQTAATTVATEIGTQTSSAAVKETTPNAPSQTLSASTTAVRSISPLPQAKVDHIREIMARVKLNPRGVTRSAENAVQATLAAHRAARLQQQQQQTHT